MEKRKKMFVTIGIAVVFAVIVTRLIFTHYTIDIISGESMFPTYQDGEIILFSEKSIEKGQVIIFKCPLDKDLLYIKRVIATGGDSIRISNSKVYVNGNQITESYICEDGFVGEIEMIIPAGTCFVMGDNRNHSTDSREFGVVPYSDVLGVAFLSKQ